MMRTRYFCLLGGLSALMLWSVVGQAASFAVEQRTYVEDFQTKDKRDVDGCSKPSALKLGCDAHAGWGRGRLTLPKVSGNVDRGTYNRMPQSRVVTTRSLPVIKPTQLVMGDFSNRYVDDDDERKKADDAIVLMDSDQGGCHLHFLKNLGYSVSGGHLGWMAGFVGDNYNDYKVTNQFRGCVADTSNKLTGTVNGAAMVSGDFNNDGWLDLVYFRSSNRNRLGALTRAYFMKNLGGENTEGVPTFATIELPSGSPIRSAGLSWHLTSDVAEVIDWDGDGRDDIVFASSTATGVQVHLFRQKPAQSSDTDLFFESAVLVNPELTKDYFGSDIARSGSGARDDDACSPGQAPRNNTTRDASRGATAIAVADFNEDGRKDIVLGGLNHDDLLYLYGNASGTFDQTTVTFQPGGVVYLGAKDFLNSGLETGVDLLIGRSGLGCQGDPAVTSAGMFLFRNLGANAGDEANRFVTREVPIAPLSEHLDFAAIGELDFDEDDFADFIAGSNARWGSYYYAFTNSWLGLYETEGAAVSTPIDDFDASSMSIVEVLFEDAAISAYSPDSARQLEFFVSNNGLAWEAIQDDELPDSLRPSIIPEQSPHKFTHFGGELRWAVRLRAAPGRFVGAAAKAAAEERNYEVTSTPPEITSLRFRATAVSSSYYSRSALEFGEVCSSGAGGCSNPREYVFSSSFSFPGFRGFLRAYDVTSLEAEGVESGINPGPDNDHLTLAWEAGEKLKSRGGASRKVMTATKSDSGRVNRLVDLSSTDPDAPVWLGVEDEVAADEVLSWVRGPMSDPVGWIMKDVGHSSPVFVGAPREDEEYAAYAEDGYSSFKTTRAGRKPTVYIGGNAGGLHAFDASNGEERWMFVPSNLLSKLKKQKSESGAYAHQYFVDGDLTVADVYDSGSSQWKSVAVVGQAKGSSVDGHNSYFALDITDPESMEPLWEFSDNLDNRGAACLGSTTRLEAVCEDNPSCNESCNQSDRVFDQQLGSNLGDAVMMNGWQSLVSSGWDNRTEGGTSYIKPATTSTVCTLASGSGEPSLNTALAQGCLFSEYRFNIYQPSEGGFSVYIRAKKLNENNGGYYLGFSEEASENPTTNSELVRDNLGSTEWEWVKSNTIVRLGQGMVTLRIFPTNQNVAISSIVLVPRQNAVVPTLTSYGAKCLPVCEPPACSTQEVEINPGDGVDECGGQQCCRYTDQGNLEGGNFCRPLDTVCESAPPDPAMGESWSKPTIARVSISNEPRWVAFMGSGYDNLGSANVGRTLYALDVLSGELIQSWTLPDEPASPAEFSTENPTVDLPNTLPGSPSMVDLDGDGLVDRLYMGDLEGKLWKLALDGPGRQSPNTWKLCTLFDAGDSNDNGVRQWAPIVTKPGIAILEGSKKEPNIYFGTGADDRAPDDVVYRFYSVRDDDPVGDCRDEPKTEEDLRFGRSRDDGKYEWVLGDGLDNTKMPKEALPDTLAEGADGERYWTDPLIMDGSIIYFASLYGKIDVVDPRESTAQRVASSPPSKVYGLALRPLTLPDGRKVTPGSSIFIEPFIGTNAKIRRSLLVRGKTQGGWTRYQNPQIQSSPANIFFQRFSDSNEEGPKLSYQGGRPDASMCIIRWREVPL